MRDGKKNECSRFSVYGTQIKGNSIKNHSFFSEFIT